jgi:LCP family protein required for cell wall assembly
LFCACLAVLLLKPSLLAMTPLRAILPAPLTHGGSATVLVLGLDRRGSEVTRTDVVLLARVGPPGQAPGAVWIPRDLLVPIPGHGSDRINTAYTWGDLDDGDGIGLARTVVQEQFRVRIDRVAVIDFRCFERAVDAVGGVDITVTETIIDPAYPTEDGGITTLRFEPGRQRFSGARALQYVRTRSADSDFGRGRRQQQVLGAFAERLRNPVNAARASSAMLKECPGHGSELGAGDLVALGALAATGGSAQIRAVDESMVSPTVLPSGAAVLLPRWEAIRPVVREVIGGETP